MLTPRDDPGRRLKWSGSRAGEEEILPGWAELLQGFASGEEFDVERRGASEECLHGGGLPSSAGIWDAWAEQAIGRKPTSELQRYMVTALKEADGKDEKTGVLCFPWFRFWNNMCALLKRPAQVWRSVQPDACGTKTWLLLNNCGPQNV